MDEKFIEKVRADFPECLEFNGGVLFWNGYAPIFIGRGKATGGSEGYYTAIIAIDDADILERFYKIGVKDRGTTKEFVMTGCYHYSSTPEEQFKKLKGIKTHWWKRSTYFTGLSECIKRYEADKKLIEEKEKSLG